MVYLEEETGDGYSAVPIRVSVFLHSGHPGDRFGRSRRCADHRSLVLCASRRILPSEDEKMVYSLDADLAYPHDLHDQKLLGEHRVVGISSGRRTDSDRACRGKRDLKTERHISFREDKKRIQRVEVIGSIRRSPDIPGTSLVFNPYFIRGRSVCLPEHADEDLIVGDAVLVHQVGDAVARVHQV